MSREKEFEKVKKLIKENYYDADCGLFDTRNIVGDYMTNIFKGKYFTLDICYNYSYFEVFGATSEEFAILKTIYNKLEKEVS